MKTRFFTLFAALALTGISYAQDEMSVRDSLFNLAGTASVDEPLDMTLLIVNPNYDGDNRAGWEGTSATQVSWGTWENWNHPFDHYQNLGSDLPNGVYELNASALHRVGNYWDSWYNTGVLSDESLRTSVLYGKTGGIDLYAPVMDLAACATYEPASEYGTAQLANGTYIPDNPESFHFYTMGGYYAENSTYIVVTDGNLTIGFRDPNYIEGQWSIVDNWQLYYLGSSDEAYALIKEQQTDLIQDLSSLFAMETLHDAYKDAVDDFNSAESAQEIIDAYAKMDSLRLALRANADAYAQYKARHDELLALMQENEIYGESRDVLERYLTEYEEGSESYPRGTYDYIIDNKTLDTAELLDEISFMNDLYTTAVENGIGNGTNITYMIKNADFSQSNFEGWEWSRTNSGNFYSRTGGKGDGWQQYSDVWLGEAWNCSFDFHQTIENTLPDGIYELDFQALYRSGQDMYSPVEKLPVEVYLNNYTTTVQNIISDGVKQADAINHQNCWIDNVGSWPQDDYSEEYGYMPNSSHGASIAFNGGRYKQKAYAIVTDGILTLGMRHTRKPYYNNDWCVWADFQLIFRAHDENAVSDMLNNMETRADMLSNLSDTYLYRGHINSLNDAISEAKSSEDNEAKYTKLAEINDNINNVYKSIECYDTLITAIEFMSEIVFSGNPNVSEERYTELENLYNDYWENIFEGNYTDEEAIDIARNIYLLPELDAIYCYGDMVDGDWDRLCLLYPLSRQENGHYTGRISIQDRSEGWGGRASLYFVYQGQSFGRETGSLDRFFTPAHNTKKLGLVVNRDDDCFNTTGGDFDVDIDLENMTIEMNPVGQYPWPENVYLAGTLPTGHWQRNDACPLAHQGDGIYEGVVTLEDFDNGRAGVTLFACRDPYDWNHARYGNAGYTNDAVKDVIYDDLNRYRGDTKWLIPVGEYCIAFDMNHERIIFCDPDVSGADGIDIVDGEISINGQVKVFTMDGRLVYEGNGSKFHPQTKTVYIIKSANGSRKKAY